MRKQSRHWETVHVVSVLCGLMILSGLFGCSEHQNYNKLLVDQIKTTFSTDSLNTVVLENLRNKKIIMMGDAHHQHGQYMRSVTGVLDHWLDQLEKEKAAGPGAEQKAKQLERPLPRKLYLFLEADSIRMDAIHRYIQTGDISTLLMFTLDREYRYGHQPGGTSVDIIEFLNDLKRIHERVNTLNALDATHPYDFQIIGAESIPPFDRPQWTKDTSVYRKRLQEFEKTKFEWFAYKRDELSSNNIRKILSENPEHKALIFYGGGHLLRGRQNKAGIGGAAPQGIDTAYGYFLVSYLDQFFSRDSVAVFFTVHRPGSEHPEMQELEHRTLSPDYRIYCNPIPPQQSPLQIINCKTTLQAFFELMKKYGAGNSEEDRSYSRAYARLLSMQLTRSYLFSHVDDRRWLDSFRLPVWDPSKPTHAKRIATADKLIKKFDAIQNISSLDEWIAKPLRDSVWYLSMLEQVLTNLPSQGSPSGGEQFKYVLLNEATKSKILQHKEDLVEYFLVNLLWIGTADEKEHARNELVKKAGLQLRTEQEWSNWWRSKYHSSR